MQAVNLVATEARLREQGFEPRRPGAASAPFPIDPDRCTSALGAWLAREISTTRFDDDASRCCLVLPSTEAGLHLAEMGERLSRLKDIGPAAFSGLLAELARWIRDQRKRLDIYGDAMFRLRTVDYRWPVYGSSAAEGADTPEQYFDFCARAIRKTGGVVIWAGLRQSRPPESLLRTMANGRGLDLLRRFEAQTINPKE